MPEYIRVLWKHALPNEPIEMHYEVLPDRSVPRMVEIFAGGRAEADTVAWHARRNPTSRVVSLVDGDMPTAAEIRAKTEASSASVFGVFESTQQEFETAFQKATPSIRTWREHE